MTFAHGLLEAIMLPDIPTGSVTHVQGRVWERSLQFLLQILKQACLIVCPQEPSPLRGALVKPL